MPTTTTRIAGLLIAAALLACGKERPAPPPTGEEAIAEVAAAKTLPPDRYVSPVSGFDVTLPGVWKGRYRAVERADTTDGGRTTVEFRFVPDSGRKVPSHVALSVRIFTRAAWQAAEKRAGHQFGAKIAERGDDVFLLFLPESNPYPPGSPEAPAFDRLIISLSLGGQQVHLTTR